MRSAPPRLNDKARIRRVLIIIFRLRVVVAGLACRRCVICYQELDNQRVVLQTGFLAEKHCVERSVIARDDRIIRVFCNSVDMYCNNFPFKDAVSEIKEFYRKMSGIKKRLNFLHLQRKNKTC